MIKLPLNKPIILMTNMGDLYCKVKFAGKDTLKLINVKRKIYTENQDYFFTDEMEDEVIIDRESVVGYSNVNIKPLAQKTTKDNSKVVNIKDFKKN